MPSRRARSATVAVVLTSLAGCSGSGGPESAGAGASTTRPTTSVATAPGSTVSPGTVPSGMRPVPGTGFRLALPDSWSAYQLSTDGTVRALAGAPPLPAGLDGLAVAAGLQGGSLYAVAPANAVGRSDTVLVTRVGGDEEPADADVSEALRQRLTAAGISEVHIETIEVGGRTAARATFHHVDELGQEQEAVTVYVPDEPASFALAFSRPLPSGAGSAETVDRITESFRPE